MNDEIINEEIKKKPPAMNIYCDTVELMDRLNYNDLGVVMSAAIKYYLKDDVPENLTDIQDIVFTTVKNDLDRAAQTYAENCRKKQEAANKRWHNDQQPMR